MCPVSIYEEVNSKCPLMWANCFDHPLRNFEPLWPAGLLLKGVCLLLMIKAGVNMEGMFN